MGQLKGLAAQGQLHEARFTWDNVSQIPGDFMALYWYRSSPKGAATADVTRSFNLHMRNESILPAIDENQDLRILAGQNFEELSAVHLQINRILGKSWLCSRGGFEHKRLLNVHPVTRHHVDAHDSALEGYDRHVNTARRWNTPRVGVQKAVEHLRKGGKGVLIFASCPACLFGINIGEGALQYFAQFPPEYWSRIIIVIRPQGEFPLTIDALTLVKQLCGTWTIEGALALIRLQLMALTKEDKPGEHRGTGSKITLTAASLGTLTKASEPLGANDEDATGAADRVWAHLSNSELFPALGEDEISTSCCRCGEEMNLSDGEMLAWSVLRRFELLGNAPGTQGGGSRTGLHVLQHSCLKCTSGGCPTLEGSSGQGDEEGGRDDDETKTRKRGPDRPREGGVGWRTPAKRQKMGDNAVGQQTRRTYTVLFNDTEYEIPEADVTIVPGGAMTQAIVQGVGVFKANRKKASCGIYPMGQLQVTRVPEDSRQDGDDDGQGGHGDDDDASKAGSIGSKASRASRASRGGD